VSKTNLPSVTSDIPKDLRYFIDRIREKLNETGTGRFVTIKELKDGGVIDTTPGGDPTPPDDGDDTTLIPVLRPPQPEGVTATAGYEFITISWNTPSYYGHQNAEVYRTAGSLFDPETEEFVATIGGFSSVFSDYVGTGQTYTYRVRFVNINNVEGPFSAEVTASSAIDVEQVLEVLEGQIGTGELAEDLANLTSGLEDKYMVQVGGDGVAFIVQSVPTVIDNVEVPAGVYINDGYIRNATIVNAMIRDAAIDNAKIVDATITSAKIGNLDAGKITTGELKSFNFSNTAGSAGFLLGMGSREIIDGEGNVTTEQETVNFIVRAGNLNRPALELLPNGDFVINATWIRDKLGSVNYGKDNQFGFLFDVDNGTVDIRDGNNDSVFKIEDGNSKGIVKMTGAAIRDYFQSFGYSTQTAGFKFTTGQSFDGSITDPSFYLRGKNGKILFAVDGDSEYLAEQIDNSFATQALIQGNLMANPLMTERDYRFGDPTPRGWYISSTAVAEVLKYADDSNSILRIDKTETQSLLNPSGDTSIDLTGTIFRVDPNVKKYRVKLRWRVVQGNIETSGLTVRMYYANTTPSSARTLTESLSHPYNSAEVTRRSGRDNLYVITADNPGSLEGDTYGLAKPSALNTWHEAELEWRDPKGEYATLSILNWIGLGSGAIVDIDYAIVEPIEQTSESIIGPNGQALSESTFAWLMDKINNANISNYIDTAAITTAYIGNAEVRTLNIDGNAVTIPEGFTQPVDETVSLGNMIPIGDWLYLPYWSRGLGPTALIINGQLQFMGDANQHQGTASIRVIAEWFTDSGTWAAADEYAKNNSFRSHSFQAQYGGQVSTMVHVPAPTSNGVFWSRGCRVRVEGTFLANDNKDDFRSITRVSLAVLGSKR